MDEVDEEVDCGVLGVEGVFVLRSLPSLPLRAACSSLLLMDSSSSSFITLTLSSSSRHTSTTCPMPVRTCTWSSVESG